MHEEKILVLDFGSQYTQLIARRIREQKIYSEIVPFNTSIDKIRDFEPKGIILSGGPSSVYDPEAPIPAREVLELGVPVLGICYGMQVMSHMLGGTVDRAVRREYGRAEIIIDDDRDIFKDIKSGSVVWMSHADRIEKQPDGFSVLAHTGNSPCAAMANKENHYYAFQFHPEVVHTEEGTSILNNFIFNIFVPSSVWTTSGWN
jgi:GMP synthase (glutamine-hydrolysing)